MHAYPAPLPTVLSTSTPPPACAGANIGVTHCWCCNLFLNLRCRDLSSPSCLPWLPWTSAPIASRSAGRRRWELLQSSSPSLLLSPPPLPYRRHRLKESAAVTVGKSSDSGGESRWRQRCEETRICQRRCKGQDRTVVQRSLQLRIEEQGKCLQIMIEQQCVPGTDKVLDASTSVEGSKLSSDPPESSTVKDVPNNSQNGTTKQAESGDDE